MNCICGYEITKNAKFCSECGKKIIYKNNFPDNNLPKMLTVKEAHEIIF